MLFNTNNIFVATRGFEINLFESHHDREGHESYIDMRTNSNAVEYIKSARPSYPWERLNWVLREATAEEKSWYIKCRKAEMIVSKTAETYPIY